MQTGPAGDEWFDVRWFAWREVRAAFAHGRTGGIALHRFRHDLRRFGFGAAEPACHMISADRARLVAFAARFGLRAAWIEPPRGGRPGRADIWHFDIFGDLLARLETVYPPPPATGAEGDPRDEGGMEERLLHSAL